MPELLAPLIRQRLAWMAKGYEPTVVLLGPEYGTAAQGVSLVMGLRVIHVSTPGLTVR